MGKRNSSPEAKVRASKYRNIYNKEHYRTISIKLNVVSDEDVIDAICESGNATNYVRSLVRKKIKKS